MKKYLPEIGDLFLYNGKILEIESIFENGEAYEVYFYFNSDVGYGITLDKILPMIWEAKQSNQPDNEE